MHVGPVIGWGVSNLCLLSRVWCASRYVCKMVRLVSILVSYTLVPGIYKGGKAVAGNKRGRIFVTAVNFSALVGRSVYVGRSVGIVWSVARSV